MTSMLSVASVLRIRRRRPGTAECSVQAGMLGCSVVDNLEHLSFFLYRDRGQLVPLL